MTRIFPLLLAATLVGQARADVVVDSINPGAAPEGSTSFAFNSIGWYYTPTGSFSLTGISTFFGFDNSASGGQTVTVQIRSERPVNGGTVLGQANFFAPGPLDTIVGGTFATPVAITAGNTYFVDFLNIQNLGINLGQYQVVNGVHVPSSGATTRRRAASQGSGTDFSFTTVTSGNGADESNGFGSGSKLEPILYFNGFQNPTAVPEPSPLALACVAAALAASAVRFRRAG